MQKGLCSFAHVHAIASCQGATKVDTKAMPRLATAVAIATQLPLLVVNAIATAIWATFEAISTMPILQADTKATIANEIANTIAKIGAKFGAKCLAVQ